MIWKSWLGISLSHRMHFLCGTPGTAITHMNCVKHVFRIVTYKPLYLSEYITLPFIQYVLQSRHAQSNPLPVHLSTCQRPFACVWEIWGRESMCRLKGLHFLLWRECVCVCMLFDRTRDLKCLVHQREAVAPSCLCECVKHVPLQSCDSSMHCGKGGNPVHRERLRKNLCACFAVTIRSPSRMPLEWYNMATRKANP